MPFCEIRIPTYKRPRWLKRALESVLAQDFPYWKAIVLDDSTDQEGREVVDALKDSRIVYSPNSKNLGSAANLDTAFRSRSLLGGTWACVLEDDNWLMPSYLRGNIDALETHNVGILMRNQSVWFQREVETTPTNQTTRGKWFTQKRYEPVELHAYLFFFEGISNGGLFWKTSIKSDLSVGDNVRDSGLQEYCRTTQILEPLYFEPEPLCVWSDMPIQLISRTFLSVRERTRGRQSVVRFIIRKYGGEIVELARRLASRLSLNEEFELALLDALYTDYDYQIPRLKAFERYLKSYARYKLIPDPLRHYFVDCEPSMASALGADLKTT